MPQKPSKAAAAGIEGVDTNKPEYPTKISALRRGLLSFIIIALVICPLIISQYDPTHSGVVKHRLPKTICVPTAGYSCSWTLELPNIVLDPSAVVFLNCLILYSLSVIVLYDAQKDDRYEDHILGLGFFGGLVVTGAMAITQHTLAPLKDYMPGIISMALLLSLCMHAILQH